MVTSSPPLLLLLMLRSGVVDALSIRG
jgi:hypothetical protein